MRFLTTCSEPDCPTLVESGKGGRCPKHAAKYERKRRARRLGRSSRVPIDTKTLLRAHPFCEDGRVCKGRNLATQVDHRVPLYEGGRNEPGNYAAICDDCHKAKGKEEASERRSAGYEPAPLASSDAAPAGASEASVARMREKLARCRPHFERGDDDATIEAATGLNGAVVRRLRQWWERAA